MTAVEVLKRQHNVFHLNVLPIDSERYMFAIKRSWQEQRGLHAASGPLFTHNSAPSASATCPASHLILPYEPGYSLGAYYGRLLCGVRSPTNPTPSAPS